MKLNMLSSPHSHSQKSLPTLMLTVILACIPGLIAQCYFFGSAVLIQLLLALITAIACESAVMLLRKRAALPVIKDFSGILTAVLLALSIPSLAPWWVILIGTFFAIVIVLLDYFGFSFKITNFFTCGQQRNCVSF